DDPPGGSGVPCEPTHTAVTTCRVYPANQTFVLLSAVPVLPASGHFPSDPPNTEAAVPLVTGPFRTSVSRLAIGAGRTRLQSGRCRNRIWPRRRISATAYGTQWTPPFASVWEPE